MFTPEGQGEYPFTGTPKRELPAVPSLKAYRLSYLGHPVVHENHVSIVNALVMPATALGSSVMRGPVPLQVPFTVPLPPSLTNAPPLSVAVPTSVPLAAPTVSLVELKS